jgi:hypothetical protein
MGRRIKSRYFSVRFSAEMLERIEQARLEIYGSRCTLAEAIRRLIEDRLEQFVPPPPHRVGIRDPGRVATSKPEADVRGRVVALVRHQADIGTSERLPRAEHLQSLAGALRVAADEISRAAFDVQSIVEQEITLLAAVSRELSSVSEPSKTDRT